MPPASGWPASRCKRSVLGLTARLSLATHAGASSSQLKAFQASETRAPHHADDRAAVPALSLQHMMSTFVATFVASRNTSDEDLTVPAGREDAVEGMLLGLEGPPGGLVSWGSPGPCIRALNGCPNKDDARCCATLLSPRDHDCRLVGKKQCQPDIALAVAFAESAL